MNRIVLVLKNWENGSPWKMHFEAMGIINILERVVAKGWDEVGGKSQRQWNLK